MNIGLLIRKNRKGRKLTLKAVAEKAGISEGFLSQVENNVSSPSVDTLVKICSSIDINAGDLLNQVENREGVLVIRKSEWDDVELPHTGFVTRRFVSPEHRAVIDSAILFVEAKKTIPVRKNIKNGQEVLCIIKGSLELIHGESTVELGEGDTVHFWSNPKKQRVINRGGGLAVALWVGTI